MTSAALSFILAGTTFAADEITFWADREGRSLEQAIAEADLLVSCPHAGAAIPAELAEWLAPELTRRLQFDFTDYSTATIVRRWAEIDPRVVVVENPHPRMVRDPNRAKPDDVVATLREAVERVAAAGQWNQVDLTGVDAIRPVTFSFFPILRVPESPEELERLCTDFGEAGERGVDVYEHTRDELIDRFLTVKSAQAAEAGGSRFTTLSFHDTMNTTTTPEGAVNVVREAKDRLPAVVALSNRGDIKGEERTPKDRPTMGSERLRTLAAAHRDGFAVSDPKSVQLNQPYLGSQEIIQAQDRFAAFHIEHPESLLVTDAVQAEFLREFLLGATATAELQTPGDGWPEADPTHIDAIAQACKASWDRYRETV